MPIRPERKHLYPADWKEIRQRILARAGSCCEQCGVRNGLWYCRLKEYPRAALLDSIASLVKGATPLPPVKIVLTIAHLNHDETDTRDENLQALCQRCHLTHDAEQHATNAAATRARKRPKPGVPVPCGTDQCHRSRSRAPAGRASIATAR